jgi:phage tail-like protein
VSFLHLNVADLWPAFDLGPDVVNDAGVLRLRSVASGFVARGAFVGGPFTVGGEAVAWFRLRALADPLAPDEHVDLLAFTSDGVGPSYNLAADAPFTDPGWRTAPRDVLDVLIGKTEFPDDHLSVPRLDADLVARRLWIGGVLRGDGTSTPRLRQMRVEHGRATALRFLPAVYSRVHDRREWLAREGLERLLALHESALGELETEITDLPRLADPAATPAGEAPSWLGWLASWLAFDLTDRWSEAQTRTLLAQAFELYGWRGTIEGLRRYLKIYAGVEARITEPPATLWSLGETSTLGFTTRLAPGAAQGAVLDSTATLDASHLTRGDDFGAALFEDVAHRFCVEVYCAELRTPGVLDDVRAVLDREKPAHTVYSLCVIEPRMRVGAQARVGIDAIVGAGPAMAGLGVPLGTATLAAQATTCDHPKEP